MTEPSKKSRPKHGHLHNTVGNKTDGRKIDTWKFSSALASNHVNIEYTVAMLKNMEFIVETKDIAKDRFSPLKGTDLQELYFQAEEIALKEFDLRTEIVWSEWLEVQVKEGSSHPSSGKNSGLNISYNVIPRGETPNGDAYTLHSQNKVLIKFPSNIGVERKAESNNLFSGRTLSDEEKERIDNLNIPDSYKLSMKMSAIDSRESNIQFTYLPNTPENRQGLDSIIETLEQLSIRLQLFLSPDEIQKTLNKVVTQGTALLNAPEVKEPSSDSTLVIKKRTP